MAWRLLRQRHGDPPILQRPPNATGPAWHVYPRNTYPVDKPPSSPLENWVVSIGAGILLLLAVALASRLAPRRSSRLRHFSTREAVLALSVNTVICCLIAIVGKSCLTLNVTGGCARRARPTHRD
jgi:hypothetical protein